MPELSAPLRVTWKVPPDPALARQLWERLVEARVLELELEVPAPSLRSFAALAENLQGARLRLALLAAPETLLEMLEWAGPAALAGVELRMLPPFQPESALEELAAATHRLTPSLWSTDASLRHFRQALEIAVSYGLPDMAILNPPAPAAPVSPAVRDAVVAAWGVPRPSWPRLQVHDLFLAEALGLEPFRGYAGCQAAHTLAHVLPTGAVVGCRTLPAVLGDLRTTPLTEIWRQPARRALRNRLAQAPESCAGCGLVAPCAGGCPGLAGDAGRDASCPGPRRPDGVA